MNLKAIQTNITVCTSTEGEAKELLAILHEGGYCWISGKSLLENNYWHYRKDDTAYLIFSDKKMIDVIVAGVFNSCMLTLAEFKERYVDFDDTFTDDCKSVVKVEEKLQAQFQVGDKVIVVTTDYNLKDVVGGIGVITKIMPHGYHIKSSTGEWFVKDKDIMPYTVFTNENPKPKFKLGDKVKVLYSPDHQGKISVVESVIRSTTDISPYCYALNGILGTFFEKCLEPYTEPEAKSTENMETKENRNLSQDITNCDKQEDKELDFCKLLKGCEGEYFYSPYLGNCMLTELKPDESHNQIWLRTDEDVWCAIPSCGHEPDGTVMLYPSRSLYEQYPLDPPKAWEVWKQSQMKFFLSIECKKWLHGKDGSTTTDMLGDLVFHTETDRDKCLKEIQVIIDKYGKEKKK